MDGLAGRPGPGRRDRRLAAARRAGRALPGWYRHHLGPLQWHMHDPGIADGAPLVMEPGNGDLSTPWHVSFHHYLTGG